MASTSILRRLLSYPLQNRKRVVVALFLLLTATVADTLGPLLIKTFIDDYLVHEHFPVRDLTLLVMLYLVATATAAVFGYGQSLAFHQIAQRAVLRIRQQIFTRVLRLPMQQFDYTPTGSLVSRITNDTEAIKELFAGVLDVYVRNSIRVVAIFVAMAWLDWRLMLVCMVFVPMVVLLMLLYRRLSTPVFQEARSYISDINSRLNESINGVKLIQIFNQQARFGEGFRQLTQKHFHVRFKGMKLDALLLRPMVDLLYLLTLASLLYYFGIQAMTSALDVGVIYAFINYLGRFTEPLIEMTQRLNIMQQSLVSASRVFEWIDRPVDPFPDESPQRIEHGGIGFQNVDFGYQADHLVLRQLNFSIAPGEFVGLVGHTGSGKSSIASLILRFYQPQQGLVSIDGVNVSDFGNRELRSRIAIVQQDSLLFSGSLLSNILIGRDIPRQKVESLCRALGLLEFIAGLPNGFNFEIAERGANLSLGQRQLVSLARALVGDPLILILDEATASLDSATEAVVQRALLAMRGRMTLIVIAHRLSTIVEADRIFVMHRGELMQQGSHLALLRVEGLYRHLYQLQTRAKLMKSD